VATNAVLWAGGVDRGMEQRLQEVSRRYFFVIHGIKRSSSVISMTVGAAA
jgi:hypothetical protein